MSGAYCEWCGGDVTVVPVTINAGDHSIRCANPCHSNVIALSARVDALTKERDGLGESIEAMVHVHAAEVAALTADRDALAALLGEAERVKTTFRDTPPLLRFTKDQWDRLTALLA